MSAWIVGRSEPPEEAQPGDMWWSADDWRAWRMTPTKVRTENGWEDYPDATPDPALYPRRMGA